jgi:hypothetical protein
VEVDERMIMPYGASSYLKRRRGDENKPKAKVYPRGFHFIG